MKQKGILSKDIEDHLCGTLEKANTMNPILDGMVIMKMEQPKAPQRVCTKMLEVIYTNC